MVKIQYSTYLLDQLLLILSVATSIDALAVGITFACLDVAILMPALQKARRMAQSTVCRSHLKEWGLIFHLYAADNETKLPQSIAGDGGACWRA